jgi:hypothetical protein
MLTRWLSLDAPAVENVITVPIVQRSKESNIPLWLTLPAVGCCAIGYLLAFRDSEYKESVFLELQDVYWIAVAYIISGGAFTFAGESTNDGNNGDRGIPTCRPMRGAG